ncbi:MAG: hypothetical protein ACYDC6_07455 [Acidobacteriaceae bacterium]
MATWTPTMEGTATGRRRVQQCVSRACSFPVLLACLLAWIVSLVFPRTIADPDLGWHLRDAAYQLHHHVFLRQDLFSFTTRGKPWMDHEWMSEIPFYLSWKWFGDRGVFVLTLGLVETILLGIFGLALQYSKNAKAAFVVGFLAVFLSSVSFGPRTLLFGWICLIAELAILFRFREGNDHTWLLPPLFMLWVNLHGSWMIGLVLLVLFSLSGCVSGNVGSIEAERWKASQLRKLAWMTLLSVAALFVNPYGWRLVLYPFDMAFHQKLNIGNVEEWSSVEFHSPRGKIVLAMMAAAIVLQLLRGRKWRLYELLFLLVGLYSGLTYSRFLFLAAILVLPMLSKDIAPWMPYYADRDKPWLNAPIIACFLAAIVAQFPSSSVLRQQGSIHYPNRAQHYLSNFHPNGNVFNEFRWGGYLIWNTRQIPVFIDSRVDVFERNGVFADYLDAVHLKGSLRILDKYKIRYVLFEKDAPLTYLLLQTDRWKIDYQDDLTILLERKAENLP